MQEPGTPFATTGQAFDGTAAAVCGLYLATHSIVVTLIGTAAASLLTGWALWLSHRQERSPRGRLPASGESTELNPRSSISQA